MDKAEQKERNRARRTALQALGLIPPPAKAAPGSMSLSSHQKRIVGMLMRLADDKVLRVSDIKHRWGKLMNVTEVLNKMIQRDLIRVNALTEEVKITPLGDAAYRKHYADRLKYGGKRW